MILIIDFGSQYNQLIARRVREHQVYCEIEPPGISVKNIKELAPEGIILSGGPASIYAKGAPRTDRDIFNLGIPILGICYGMQFMMETLGGKVIGSQKREYGFAELNIKEQNGIFAGVETKTPCWMSHGDSVGQLPEGFVATASTGNTQVAAAEDASRRFYGLQFHPEVAHTKEGRKIIANFLFDICRCEKSWSMKSFIENTVDDIRAQVGKEKVILGLSGGVDSSVAAVLLHKAIGRQLTCVFVDNGVLRANEVKRVIDMFKKYLQINLRVVRAGEVFLKKLRGVADPERKRKIIGRTFIEVFDREAHKIKGVKLLAQGTLYPDLIESRSAFGGPSVVIKSHHNVGGLPKTMKLKLIEPLKHLFKDEVRLLGKELSLPDDVVWRQPFPGPGLAVRIIGDVTIQRLNVLRKADKILLDEICAANLYYKLWQSFTVLLPLKSVGIMGDQRTYENIVAIRAVTSDDAMTADWARLPHDFLARVSNRIINEVRGVNRVVYDISSKPPSTIEWE
ncbi:MAG TPA: glutamine-hydrolyzing GMP synthase [Smithellaceae bacterium]|jgi:GMP synthase (glutamine-hydrolysing)|nr:glutamine-hydrolyzing GMP synthase [Smithellaceae bacterium]HNT90832.1 glutamine-hydrolyzing GMP synthase [Smithellaceae bacterium]HNV64219.1 glutamine-hydrolyzing GMP synthase [Smithellaceae bacterium]HOD30469.1 glutamine-hydrolyzing GMP synthase [Smithellaceae bacterium]HPG53378.1 glutamine-hydrolyzing GMP synthase [Smithellaceae bacterium]